MFLVQKDMSVDKQILKNKTGLQTHTHTQKFNISLKWYHKFVGEILLLTHGYGALLLGVESFGVEKSIHQFCLLEWVINL